MAAPARWEGVALGARVSIEINGPRAMTEPALKAARATLRSVEQRFSLYEPTSDLSLLNRQGALRRPNKAMLDLMRQVGEVYQVTEGLFDPTVQVIWEALRRGEKASLARDRVGWDRVRYDREQVRLGPGQALTFNGIAQGYATDLVTTLLKARGFGDLYVNIGEQAAQGRPRRLGIIDPVQGLLGSITLRDAAIATSSPAATPIGRSGHILSPFGADPLWSTVTVRAPLAAQADGLSTALCLADWQTVRRVHSQLPDVGIICADAAGDIRSLGI
ncbi:MAG: FAD:protein FMN transferase [Pseudomonadota bacterium]